MRQTRSDFLVEIGTEELPPKPLYQLASCFCDQLAHAMVESQLSYDEIKIFATPRRIGLLITSLTSQQPDRTLEKIGPSIAVAYDASGNPTAAALGFAKACQVAFSSLEIKDTPKGKCLYYANTIQGECIFKLAPKLVKKALDGLPIAKPMNWGEHTTPFIRPVHWILMIYGNQVVPCQLFGLQSGNQTFGHRFHHPGPLEIKEPNDYTLQLEKKGYVVPSYQQRKSIIRERIISLGKSKGQVIIEEDLLDEVTGLVEWPVAFLGSFDPRFLQVPPEALISVMKVHQKCFPIIDSSKQLKPYFIAVANIESKEPRQVVIGNERVMLARLSDAEFFYRTDLKHGLEHYLENLRTVVFAHKLGTMHDKVNRISKLAGYISAQLQTDAQLGARAGLLCKADLTTEMVGEFPELQGIMGYYYALKDNELLDIAIAIKEHYLPRFSGDDIPKSIIGSVVALADRLDTLIGIFGIYQAPTGEKDPFALRRAAMGILRILIENQLPLDLKTLLIGAKKGYPYLENSKAIEETLDFTMERLRRWYLEREVPPDVYASVLARYPTSPLDFDKRIKAIVHFQKFPEALALTSANKRVTNILKQASKPSHNHLNYGILQHPAEKELVTLIEKMTKEVEELCKQNQYTEALTLLAQLKDPIDRFFDKVMVMTEEEDIRNNRLILLNNLRNLFLLIGDVSLLQSS